ncbi:MAG TPA: transglutaminase family protein, partial [Vicinamibacterales bacterium]|nr:transglutaminase family protein [Vicinamibacterales bacterium]
MAIHVALRHQTRYSYDRPVSLSPHVIRLRPAPHCRTPVLSYSLKLDPKQHFINWQQDPFGNYLARVVFPNQTRELVVDVELVAEMSVTNPFDFFLEPSAEAFPFSYEPALAKDLAPFLERLPATPRFGEFVDAVDRRPQRTVDFLVALNRSLSQSVKYIIRLEPGVQTPDETLALASGSCRDSAWVLVQVLRHLGLAARFVSGYLIQLEADVKALDGPTGPEADFTDLHAWTEVYLPGAGWIGLDPTSGLMAGEGHIPLAATPDPQSAAPVSGAVDECEVIFGHEMTVRRIHESPRVTKPYTDDQWTSIDALGRQIDAELSANDVRLTMGGEPTFVSVDDMDGAEWNFTALGTAKRELAGALVRRLKQRFAPGALLHFGQGKWYPGESLPRWALGCWWRRDSVPVWQDDALIADETVDYGHGGAEAGRFVHALADALAIDGAHVIPAYEDVWHYLRAERRLPLNVDPLKSELKDEEERARLARVFEQGLDTIVGYVLPVKRRDELPWSGWTSGRWFLRSEHLFLIPGDSSIGYRLPLDSLPWSAPDDVDEIIEMDPFARRDALPQRQLAVRTVARGAVTPGPQVSQQPPPRGKSAAGVIRTALCVEPRHGRIHVFMPPVRTTEDYLALIATIERTAARLKMPV